MKKRSEASWLVPSSPSPAVNRSKALENDGRLLLGRQVAVSVMLGSCMATKDVPAEPGRKEAESMLRLPFASRMEVRAGCV